MATQLFRSVGITATDLGGAETMQIVGSTMTTTAGLADNIGLGDAIPWNDGADQLAFIHGRTSSTVYTVKDKDGGTPTAASAGQAFGVFRCYVMMANARARVENGNITEPTENDVNPSLDLVAADIQVNFVAYADGSDTSTSTWGGRTTDATRFVKFFTPVSSSEVGVTQRHNGTLQAATTAYRLDQASTANIMQIGDGFMRIEGIQYTLTPGVDATAAACIKLSTDTQTQISHCVMKGVISSGTTNKRAIWGNTADGRKIWNNVIYDFESGGTESHHGILSSGGILKIFSNTIVNCRTGIEESGSADMLLKNNAVQTASGTSSAYVGTFNASSTNNLSDIADAPGSNPINSVALTFVDSGNDDFHLDISDTLARKSGADLRTDSDIAVTDDIDRQGRKPIPDIGADEIIRRVLVT